MAATCRIAQQALPLVLTGWRIAATVHGLEECVGRGAFRQDLLVAADDQSALDGDYDNTAGKT